MLGITAQLKDRPAVKSFLLSAALIAIKPYSMPRPAPRAGGHAGGARRHEVRYWTEWR